MILEGEIRMQKGVVRKCLRFFTLYNIETFRDRVFEMIPDINIR